MKRVLFGSMALLPLAGASAWAQAAPPKAAEEGGSALGWLLLFFFTFGAVYLFYSLYRTRKTYGVVVDRSLQIAEESLQIAKQQAALQAETNRLLKQLLEAQGQGDRI